MIFVLNIICIAKYFPSGPGRYIANLDGGDVPQIVNHCTAFNDRCMMFFITFFAKK